MAIGESVCVGHEFEGELLTGNTSQRGKTRTIQDWLLRLGNEESP